MNSVWCFSASSSEIVNFMILKELLEIFLCLVGQKEGNLSTHVFIKKMSIIAVLFLRGSSECYTDNLVLSQEEFRVTSHIVSQLFEGTSSHVLKGQNVTILVLVKSLMDIVNKILLAFFALLLDLGQSHNLISL